eukprot:2975392-Rhodomonas_salina.2
MGCLGTDAACGGTRRWGVAFQVSTSSSEIGLATYIFLRISYAPITADIPRVSSHVLVSPWSILTKIC